MMPEPSRSPASARDGHGVDRADTRRMVRQQLIVGQVGEKLDGSSFNLIASRTRLRPSARTRREQCGRHRIRVEREVQPNQRPSHKHLKAQLPLDTFRPTTSQASAMKASRPMAEIMCGDGYFSKKARNQSVRALR